MTKEVNKVGNTIMLMRAAWYGMPITGRGTKFHDILER